MTEHVAIVEPSVTLEALVLRAVPCDAHREYVADCPDCLTGEQARDLGIAQPREKRNAIVRLFRR